MITALAIWLMMLDKPYIWINRGLVPFGIPYTIDLNVYIKISQKKP